MLQTVGVTKPPRHRTVHVLLHCQVHLLLVKKIHLRILVLEKLLDRLTYTGYTMDACMVHSLLYIQVAPTLGTGLMSDISYTVTFTGSSPLQFTMTTCNSTSYCTLRVLGSGLFPSGPYTVSVVASNIVGRGQQLCFLIQVSCLQFM